MARDRIVNVHLRATNAQYLAAMRSSSDATKKFARDMTTAQADHRAAWADISRTATVGGLALAVGLGMAVAKFADFDAAMSAAGAATRASAADLQALRDAAMSAGADTQYSATEAAQAVTELGKAGVSTADILGGGLTGALNLAAAGQMDVARAGELSAVAMKQFGLRGADLSHVADLLAAGAGKAVGSVDDMGMALKQSGLVAAQTGLSIEETTGALAAFASAGLIGSDAGTSLKTMLQRLTPQSREAAAVFDDLGISAYDSQGQFIGLSHFAGQLQAALKDMSAEQRNAALTTMFGSDAVRAAAVLYDEGAAGVAQWTADVNDAGFAAEQAAALTDNLRGDLERLGGAFDTALIQSGSAANDALRALVQGVEGAVEKFSALPAPVQAALVGGAALTSGTLLLGGAMGALLPKVTAASASLVEYGVISQATAAKSATLAKSLGVVGAAAAALTVAGSAMESVWLDSMGASDDAAKSLDAYLTKGRESADVTQVMSSGFSDLGAALERTLNGNAWVRATNGLSEVSSLFGVFGTTQADDAIAFFGQMDAALAGFVGSGRAAEASKVFGTIADEAQRQGFTLAQVQDLLPAYTAALGQAGGAAGGAAAHTSAAADAAAVYAAQAETARRTTTEWAQALRDYSSPALDAREAVRAWRESIVTATEALTTNGRTLSLSTEKGRANQRALDGMAKAAIENVSAMAANGASQRQLQGTLAASKQRLAETAERFGMTKTQARKYAEQVLSIPETVDTAITAHTSVAARRVKALADAMDALKNKDLSVTVTTYTKNAAAHGGTTDIAHADGGYISGPGTSTSDSIPALLSDGEYIVKAAAVAKYGRHFLDRVNAMRFAGGGYVDTPSLPWRIDTLMPAAATPAMSDPAPVASLAGVVLSGTLDTPFGPAQVRGVVRSEIRSEARSIAAGVR